LLEENNVKINFVEFLVLFWNLLGRYIGPCYKNHPTVLELTIRGKPNPINPRTNHTWQPIEGVRIFSHHY